MRYIEKRDEPAYLTSYKQIQLQAGLFVSYQGFREKEGLNELLRGEQHHICCYCQQRLTHYNSNKEGAAHNEHLIPQCADPGDGSIELNYHNIYACCMDSRGQSKKHQHCGESKHESLIKGFIQEQTCGVHFKYNISGEILPNGSYSNWSDYVSNATTLIGEMKDAYDTINILNLNCNRLVTDRKNDITTLISLINKCTKQEVDETIVQWESENHYFRFIDALLYYMKRKK